MAEKLLVLLIMLRCELTDRDFGIEDEVDDGESDEENVMLYDWLLSNIELRLSMLDGMTSMKISFVVLVVIFELPDVFELDVDDDDDKPPDDEL